jgi:hypothetical protein
LGAFPAILSSRMTVTPVGVRPSPTRVAHAGLDCFYKRILYPPFFTAADETLLRRHHPVTRL